MIYKHLVPIIETFNPCIFLPSAFIMLITGELYRRNKFDFKIEIVELRDGGKIEIEWHYADNKEAPVVVFSPGICGTSNGNYTNDCCKMVNDKGWNFVIVNRRGFGKSKLYSSTFIPYDECKDIKEVIDYIQQQKANSNLYLLGVSAGANLFTNYLGKHPNENRIKAFVSISNPFNIGRVVNRMENSLMGRVYSWLLARNLKKMYIRHNQNEHFVNLLEQRQLNVERLKESLKGLNSVWQIDKTITKQFGDFDTIYDYYYNNTSEYVIEHVTTPSLLINNKEDPICAKEFVPIERINRNKNLILLITDRGGHVEYLSGWKMEWWGFKMALSYFDYFQENDEL